MPNKNYQAGRRVEYEVIKIMEAKGYKAFRTAGSHGEFDVVAYKWDRLPYFIQCKRITKENQRAGLIREFQESVAIPCPIHYNPVLAIKLKGDKEPTLKVF